MFTLAHDSVWSGGDKNWMNEINRSFGLVRTNSFANRGGQTQSVFNNGEPFSKHLINWFINWENWS